MEITFLKLKAALESRGISGLRVESTGGGCATAYADLPGGNLLAIGPGWFAGMASTFDSGDLSAGVESPREWADEPGEELATVSLLGATPDLAAALIAGMVSRV